MGFYYIRDYINNENEDITKISDEIKKYNQFYQDICKSPVGKYSINKILETVEESLNYLEIFSPNIKKWAEEYLEKNRGILWLYYGVEKGTYLTDYWKQSETKIGELQSMWPFLFNRDDRNYKGFIIDLEDAQTEILRQRKRQNTSNPNYKPFHPDGCSGCSCWMLDDMEQWFEEELKEKQESRNIFFNSNLQKDFYPLAIQDIELLKEQWSSWTPIKNTSKEYNNNEIKIIMGQTPINLVLSWMKDDFNYSLFSMFDWSDTFENVWNRIDSVENFIICQRQKLKKIVDLL